MDWEEVTLKDIAFYRNEKVKCDKLSFDSYISTENMVLDRGGVTLASSLPTTGSSNIYFKADILVSNIRPYFKKIWFADKTGACSNDVLVFAIKNEKIDASYLYYKLSTDNFFDYVMSGSNGVKMPRGNKKSIMDYKLLLPPLKTQKKIANILSNYDQLIENNNQRIKLLESMAEEIYKEWFVRLRFPDYEKVEKLNWNRKRLNDICKFFNGKSAVNSEDGKYPIYGANGIIGSNHNYNYENIIIIGRVGIYCGNVFHIKEKCWATDNTIIIQANEDDILFLKYYLQFKNLNNYAGGSAQPLLTQTQIKSLVVDYPSKQLIKNFNTILQPMDKEIGNLIEKNKNLKETRDLLLPRFINGKVM
ncbi:MAG: Type I restriction-modification system, specificity subunit S (EC [uncultured Sulfurovum sp.]|uniref:Type I restriction-modification system, specificity subunit S (EC) n=1 Tax=uncultured Sulfurovum sp. TaxID=269237 RepID=A0A6S6SNY6_9BACT|nr:MAG: Type I restriction-modification system, specificity subunit S (EC [uncultured Sulfurovum sp.]